MPKYAVDPDGVEHMAVSLRLAAELTPNGRLHDAAGCGSPAVEAAVESANAEFHDAWQRAYEALDGRTRNAVTAALRYRDSDNRVYAGAERARR